MNLYIGKTVQIPAWSDAWMMGDRYGTIIGLTKARNWHRRETEIWGVGCRVKMNVSGRILRFLESDLTFYED